MEEITLRSYQKELIKETRTGLKLHNRVIMQAPTGSGKSLCFSDIALKSQERNSRILILSNRTKILLQNGGTLKSFGLDVTYIRPRNTHIPINNISVGNGTNIKEKSGET